MIRFATIALLVAFPAYAADVPSDRPVMLQVTGGTLATEGGPVAVGSGWYLTAAGYERLDGAVRQLQRDAAAARAERDEAIRQANAAIEASNPVLAIVCAVLLAGAAGYGAAVLIQSKGK